MKLHDGSTTDDMIEWLREIALIADPFDAANLNICADRLSALYYGAADTVSDEVESAISKSLRPDV